nr:hypothetical protein [Salidesulfovibrio onnuriiensis]
MDNYIQYIGGGYVRGFLLRQKFVGGLYFQLLSILPENLVAIRAGHNDSLYVMLTQLLQYPRKTAFKIILSPQIMGRFVAAVEYDTRSGYMLLKGLEKGLGRFGSGAGKGAARKEDSVAAFGDVVMGEKA